MEETEMIKKQIKLLPSIIYGLTWRIAILVFALIGFAEWIYS